MAPSFSFYKVGLTLAILIVFLGSSTSANNLNPDKLNPLFYSQSCPRIFDIVRQHVYHAIMNETRMGASLLRLHFHDCFVNGCDGSVLLDDTASFKGEKRAGPNLNSIRGFEVVDNIKDELEKECPGVVSCADILAVAARDSVKILDGPFWTVQLGRRDATTASQAAANQSLPSPTLDFDGLVSKFNNVSLNIRDLIALSGAHTIGKARCISFKNRLYNKTEVIDRNFAQKLQRNCPKATSRGDDNLAGLDAQTPDHFDNDYYTNLVDKEGLLHSDQQLYSNGGESTDSIVRMYSENIGVFYNDFAEAMIRMGSISPLTGHNQGEIRKNCQKPN